MIFPNPPTHSQAYPNVIMEQSLIIIAHFCKMGVWELHLELTYARIFKHVNFFARMINRLILPYSHLIEKSVGNRELALLDCLSGVWEWMGGSDA